MVGFGSGNSILNSLDFGSSPHRLETCLLTCILRHNIAFSLQSYFDGSITGPSQRLGNAIYEKLSGLAITDILFASAIHSSVAGAFLVPSKGSFSSSHLKSKLLSSTTFPSTFLSPARTKLLWTFRGQHDQLRYLHCFQVLLANSCSTPPAFDR